MTVHKTRPKPSTTVARGGARRTGERSKKTLLLDQRLLDRARQALGVRTETEAITQALEAVLRRERQIQGLRALAALGPIDATRID